MGGALWSDAHYTDRATLRAASATPTFKYDADVKAGKVDKKAHKTLDPHGVGIRESCDSDAHPESRAVVVFCDVTGSMGEVPKVVQKKLPQLMGLLLRKGYLAHPQIMIGAIGDATSDVVPLQVGQFESGIEIEDNLTNLFLEGGGGGSNHESYELGLYFIARHTKIDCYEKRGQKGFCFLIGDEMPYKDVKKDEVLRVIGDTLQADIPISSILEELCEKYEVFFIIPNMTSNYNLSSIHSTWKKLLGQRAVKLDDPDGISEFIASMVGAIEGVEIDDIAKDLADAGVAKSVTTAVTTALSRAGGADLSKKTKGADLALVESGIGSGITTL